MIPPGLIRTRPTQEEWLAAVERGRALGFLQGPPVVPQKEMKKRTPKRKMRRIAAKIATFALLLACSACSTPQTRWLYRHSHAVYILHEDGRTNEIEVGLRADGVVVWREVTPDIQKNHPVKTWITISAGTSATPCGDQR